MQKDRSMLSAEIKKQEILILNAFMTEQLLLLKKTVLRQKTKFQIFSNLHTGIRLRFFKLLKEVVHLKVICKISTYS
jgi:hypothetical protein